MLTLTRLSLEGMSEHIPIEESLSSQQQTVMWNEEKYLRIAPGERLLLMSTQRNCLFPLTYLLQRIELSPKGFRAASDPPRDILLSN
ncbi:hypothetical protein TNCV_4111451 [Trichonephila clavipes]|nr:hypothetical protein TNCV_4111451 [Trichonephila clavipes]